MPGRTGAAARPARDVRQDSVMGGFVSHVATKDWRRGLEVNRGPFVERMMMNPQATTPTLSAAADAACESAATKDRLERILMLQRQAIYPLDQVSGVWAQSQLAQVEVPWLTRSLQDALIRIGQLESRGRAAG